MNNILLSIVIFIIAGMVSAGAIVEKQYWGFALVVVFAIGGIYLLVKGILEIKSKVDYNKLLNGTGGYSTQAEYVDTVETKDANGNVAYLVNYKYKDEQGHEHKATSDLLKKEVADQLKEKKNFSIKCYKSSAVILFE